MTPLAVALAVAVTAGLHPVIASLDVLGVVVAGAIRGGWFHETYEAGYPRARRPADLASPVNNGKGPRGAETPGGRGQEGSPPYDNSAS